MITSLGPHQEMHQSVGPEVLDKTIGRDGGNTTKNKFKRHENFRRFHSASKGYSTEQGKL